MNTSKKTKAHGSNSRKNQRNKQLLRFQKVAREVLIMNRVCKRFHIVSNFSTEFDLLDTVEKQALRNGKDDQGNLSFDLNYFKLKEDKFPTKLVAITQKKPEWRTEDEVKQLRSIMSCVTVFRRYSNTLQQLLARVIRYQRFGRRRAVVKKGHRGSSFYFVYSGKLAVTKDEDGTSAFVDKEPIVIKKGAGFGDVALIKGLKRNATVVCLEETELLVVDKEDFFANKMDVELKKEFDYRFTFYRSLDLMFSWPSTLIEQIADHSKTEEFLFGRVVVRNTNETENIIFISKGRCDVLRLVDLTTCSTYHKWIRQQTARLKDCKYQIKNTGRKTGGTSGRWAYPRGAADGIRCVDRDCADVVKEEKEQNREALSRFPKQTSHLFAPSPYGDVPCELATAVCFRIDTLPQGHIFGLHQYLIPDCGKDTRSFVLASQGAEILRFSKEKFYEHVDPPTLAKLKTLEKVYPSDEELCQIFLEHNRWRLFKKDMVHNLKTHNVKSGFTPYVSCSAEEHLDGMGILSLSSEGSQRVRPRSAPNPKAMLLRKERENVDESPSTHLRLIDGITFPQRHLCKMLSA